LDDMDSIDWTIVFQIKDCHSLHRERLQQINSASRPILGLAARHWHRKPLPQVMARLCGALGPWLPGSPSWQAWGCAAQGAYALELSEHMVGRSGGSSYVEVAKRVPFRGTGIHGQRRELL